MPMLVTQYGDFISGRLENPGLTDKDRVSLLKLANEELEDELLEMMDSADQIARPVVFFGVCPVDNGAAVNGISIPSELVREKLQGRNRCFPYISTCGRELEQWSKQYDGDILAEYWADEIKKRFLYHITQELFQHLKLHYHTTGHLTALNPGSLEQWPVSGQRELFAILGGQDTVEEAVGVTYTESFLMLPSKTVSGIAFESEVFYENCQHCPLTRCPNRRAQQVT